MKFFLTALLFIGQLTGANASSLFTSSGVTLTRNQVKERLNRLEVLFKDEILKNASTFSFQLEWDRDQKTAFADKKGKNWKVVIGSGIYNNPTMTYDALVFIACHELGHLIGGAPYSKSKVGDTPLEFMSTEGQADLWGSGYCMKKYIKAYPEKVIIKDQSLAKLCLDQGQNLDECYRHLEAAIAANNTMAYIQKENPVNIHEKVEDVSNTIKTHPKTACRLETTKNGALCDIENDLEKITSSFMSDPTSSGKPISCVDKVTGREFEARALCWYNEKLKYAHINFRKIKGSPGIWEIEITVDPVEGDEVELSIYTKAEPQNVLFLLKGINSSTRSLKKKFTMTRNEYDTLLKSEFRMVLTNKQGEIVYNQPFRIPVELPFE